MTTVKFKMHDCDCEMDLMPRGQVWMSIMSPDGERLALDAVFNTAYEAMEVTDRELKKWKASRPTEVIPL